MQNSRIISVSALIAITMAAGCTRQPTAEKNSFASGADSIIRLMTLDEKIGQLSLFTSDFSTTGPTMRSDYIELIKQGKAGAVFNAYTVDFVRNLQKTAVEETRLHIPLIFGYDVIHGHRTIFPIPLAEACAWDTAMVQKAERIAAIEATAEGINWTFAPMVDLARDPRWGRVMEGAGEGTFLGNYISAARVRGFQGKSLADSATLMACVKHFAAYGAPQGGRDYNTVDMSDRSLSEWYLPVYKAAVDAGAGSLMTAFNEIAGIPCTSNEKLINDTLRNLWKFDGFVVSDYGAINELIPHGVAADQTQAADLAINSGVDMDMQGSAYLNQLSGLVKAGKVTERTINDAVKRILIAKYKLGLFEDPYRYCDKKRETTDIMRPEFLSFAREVAAKSCVLLKNSNKTLPVPKNLRTIAVIGPLADSKADMLGSWAAAGNPEKSVTLLEGIRNKVEGKTIILTSKGCNVDDSNTSGFGEAVVTAGRADFVILALGESRDMSGESASRTHISLPGVQMRLAEAVIKTGKPVAVVLFNGRPLALPGLDSIAPAILEAWYGGTEAGNGVADILFGDVNPSGKVTMSFPYDVGQITVFYNTKNTGRPINPDNPHEKYKSNYLDAPNAPLYPFGYGLSYTTFSYSDITLNKKTFRPNDEIRASVNITNTGDRDGEEIAQLYIRDLVGDVTRPVLDLRGFRRVAIGKGQTVTVSFSISPKMLSYYHKDMSFSFDPGEFVLFIGTSSKETRQIGFAIE
ncbi:MAG: glycoside hydrolase family 3 N-terminal domain-containing protein [Bacteroidales bacterium]